MRFLLSG